MDISRYKRRTLSGEGMEEGKDGPLRDTDTNRDINTNRSFIFFYVPTRGTRRRRRRRILTRTRLRPRENFLPPPSHQHARLHALSRNFTAHDSRSVDATTENFMTASCPLSIFESPHPFSSDHVSIAGQRLMIVEAESGR